VPVIRINPVTAADNFYALGEQSPSTMAFLQNLVPAPDSAQQWIPRPAATVLAGSQGTLPGGFTFGVVSCMKVIGDRVYGMCASDRAAGQDEPFCYDILGGAFVTITGITASNTPSSPPSSGAWTPPHMDLVGTRIIIAHTGYSGSGSNFFGSINIANPSALTYASSNTATNALPVVPSWVVQFNQRAWFFCNIPNGQPALLASNTLDALTRTNGSYTLTLNDNVPLLCGGVYTVTASQFGGQTSALFVFKQGASQIYQVKGDFVPTPVGTFPTFEDITMNLLPVATGTFAANTVTSTPLGLTFVAPDGVRMVNFDGQVTEPLGSNGQGKVFPFMATLEPTRMVSACNGSVLRISSNDASVQNSPRQEWVYDLPRRLWHGPHTFPISLVAQHGAEAVIAPVGITGLWQQSMSPTSSSTYMENGATYMCVYQTAFFPDRVEINQLSTVKAVYYRAFGSETSDISIAAIDARNNIIDFASVQSSGMSTLWDQFAWGAAVWLGAASPLSAEEIPWNYPLVFDRMAIQISVTAAAGLKFGHVSLIVEELGYTVQKV